MKIHHMGIRNDRSYPYLDYIKSGIKTVEGRKYSPTYFQIKPNDIIIFHANNQTVVCRVLDTRAYETLESYVQNEMSNALPNIKKVSDGMNLYNKLNSPEQRKKLRDSYGYEMIAIELEVVKEPEALEFIKEAYQNQKKQYLELKKK